MALDYDSFINYFPAFTNQTQFPPDRVQVFIDLANLQVDSKFGSLQAYVAGLWAAHNIVIEEQQANSVNQGLLPGDTVGVLKTVSAGTTSTTWDTNIAVIEGAGQWNTTFYGRRYYEYNRMFGAGPTQVVPGPFIDNQGLFSPFIS